MTLDFASLKAMHNHGFAIQDELRNHFSHVESFLMDRASLDAHVAFWGRKDKPQCDDPRDNRIRESLRLEQEHLSFGWVHKQIDQLLRQD